MKVSVCELQIHICPRTAICVRKGKKFEARRANFISTRSGRAVSLTWPLEYVSDCVYYTIESEYMAEWTSSLCWPFQMKIYLCSRWAKFVTRDTDTNTQQEPTTWQLLENWLEALILRDVLVYSFEKQRSACNFKYTPNLNYVKIANFSSLQRLIHRLTCTSQSFICVLIFYIYFVSSEKLSRPIVWICVVMGYGAALPWWLNKLF